MKKKTILTLTYSAMCVAMAIVFPFITGNIPRIGNMLCPMHIPVMLCGFICGPVWGLAVGVVSPLLRSVIVGFPVMFPDAVSMAFELATYAVVIGVIYRRLPKSAWSLYVSLLCSMVAGRVVWGAVMYAIAGFTETSFSFAAFSAGAVSNAVPGIIVQLFFIPLVVAALEGAKLVPHE